MRFVVLLQLVGVFSLILTIFFYALWSLCRAHEKWNKIASDIKLVLYSSTIKMMHGPIKISVFKCFFTFWEGLLTTTFVTLKNFLHLPKMPQFLNKFYINYSQHIHSQFLLCAFRIRIDAKEVTHLVLLFRNRFNIDCCRTHHTWIRIEIY